MLIFLKTLPSCLRSNEMYGFSLAPRYGLQSHKASTCCFAESLYCTGFGVASNPYISFDLKQKGTISGKTARRGVAAAAGKARGGNYPRILAPPCVCHTPTAALVPLIVFINYR